LSILTLNSTYTGYYQVKISFNTNLGLFEDSFVLHIDNVEQIWDMV